MQGNGLCGTWFEISSPRLLVHAINFFRTTSTSMSAASLAFIFMVSIRTSESLLRSIPHEPLMTDIGRYIADGRIMGLIEGFLKQGILEGIALWTPEKGSPQGAVISPLLANLYLHPVDTDMAAAGHEMIRYADDFVILCRSREEAEKALALVQRLTLERGLTLHPDKTRVVDIASPGQGFDLPWVPL